MEFLGWQPHKYIGREAQGKKGADVALRNAMLAVDRRCFATECTSDQEGQRKQ